MDGKSINPISQKEFHYTLTDKEGDKYDLTLAMPYPAVTTAIDKPRKVVGTMITAHLVNSQGDNVDPEKLFHFSNQHELDQVRQGTFHGERMDGQYTALGRQVGDTIGQFIKFLHQSPNISVVKYQTYNPVYPPGKKEILVNINPVSVDVYNEALNETISRIEKPSPKLTLDEKPIGSLRYVDASKYRKAVILWSLEEHCPDVSPKIVESLTNMILAATNLYMKQDRQDTGQLYTHIEECIRFADAGIMPDQINDIIQDISETLKPSEVIQR